MEARTSSATAATVLHTLRASAASGLAVWCLRPAHILPCICSAQTSLTECERGSTENAGHYLRGTHWPASMFGCAPGTHQPALLLVQWSARHVEPHSLSLAWPAQHRRKQGCGSALQGGGASPAGSSAVCGITLNPGHQLVSESCRLRQPDPRPFERLSTNPAGFDGPRQQGRARSLFLARAE